MKDINVKEVLAPVFEKLNIKPFDFTYDEELNYYISDETFKITDDPEEYFIVVKMSENAGDVVIGSSDGLEFFEYRKVGSIALENDQWIIK